MKYVLAWFALACILALLLGQANWRSYRRLAASAVEVEGRVVEKRPQMHNRVRYEFAVDGRTFEGEDQSGWPNPPLANLGIGDRLSVFHDPQDPKTSMAGAPRLRLKNETISIAFAALCGAAVIVWALRIGIASILPKR